MHIIYGPMNGCLWKGLSKEENIELGFEQSGELPILDRLNIETRQTHAKRFQIVFWNF